MFYSARQFVVSGKTRFGVPFAFRTYATSAAQAKSDARRAHPGCCDLTAKALKAS
jgi:hypothetical protein